MKFENESESYAYISSFVQDDNISIEDYILGRNSSAFILETHQLKLTTFSGLVEPW